MRFVVFVEGHSEKQVVPAFLKRWLDPRLRQPVGINAVRFDGWAALHDDVAQRAHVYLDKSLNPDVVAVVSLLDLYGPDIYPDDVRSAAQRARWGAKHIEGKVNHEKFRHFFAVHELEAWLLSQPDVFPPAIRKLLPKKPPENVNFDMPPARLLSQLYLKAKRKDYKKIVNGRELFQKLDPDVAREKCPNLKLLLDTMLELAESAGLPTAPERQT